MTNDEEEEEEEEEREEEAEIKKAKQEIRVAALLRRRTIPLDSLLALSSRIAANFFSLREYQEARLLISYCAKGDEVQTRPIIEGALAAGKRVAVVVTHVATRTLTFSEIKSYEGELAPGPFGILEPRRAFLRPVELSQAGLILVPLVAWDVTGGRLGYGMGYFDRALAGDDSERLPIKVGLALESQRVQKIIPRSWHDVPLDVIVTEERIVRPAAAAGNCIG
jgi:5-formyltetrahydrofolate cyclo-ligase